MLTPLQLLLINKRMPKGYKLELEENLLKYMESIKPPAKKPKLNVIYTIIFYFMFYYYLFKIRNLILFYDEINLI